MKMSEGPAALLALAISLGLMLGGAAVLVSCWELNGFILVLASWPFALWGLWLGAMRVLVGKRSLE